MDFLDPKYRKRHQIRLIIGYFLVSVAIILGTTILVYSAYGYGINTKTGDIVQNGLLFVDSIPGGAEVYLNGQDLKTTTAARLLEPAGDYTLSLSKAGYHDWKHSFTLNEHSVGRYTYPILFPDKPVISSLKTYSSMPPLVTQSPDRRWLLVQLPSGRGASFDVYDTTDLSKAPTTLDIPAALLSDDSGQLSVVQWSTDNDHLIVKHDLGNGNEYLVISRSKPSESFNINQLFKLSPSDVAMVNSKADQLYIYDQRARTIRPGNVSDGTEGNPIIKNVLAFEPYASNQIAYITDANQPRGQVQARVWDGVKSYPVYTFNAGSTYLLDVQKYSGTYYFVAGSNTSERVNIYKDPLSDIKNPAIAKAIPVFALRLNNVQKLSFSENFRMVSVEAGQQLAVYDLETSTPYRYQLSMPLAAPLHWLDGFHLIGSSNGNILIMDYDSTNQQQALAATADPNGAYFSRDSKHLIDLRSTSDGVELVNIDMRAGSDLPKQLQNQ